MSLFSYEDDVPFDPTQRYDTLSDVQSVGGGHTLPPETPSVSGNSTTDRVLRSRTSHGCSSITLAEADRLGFLPLAEWDEYNSYEEGTPSHLRYSIEWKIAVNNRAIAKDTEQDVVLAPAVYWRMYLQAKVEKLVDKKLPRSRRGVTSSRSQWSISLKAAWAGALIGELIREKVRSRG